MTGPTDYSRIFSELKIILLSFLAGGLAASVLLAAIFGRPLAAAIGSLTLGVEWERISRFLLINSTLLTAISLALYVVHFCNDDLLCVYRDTLVVATTLLLLFLGIAHVLFLPLFY